MQNQTRQLSGNRERRGAGSTYVCVLSHCGKAVYSRFLFSFLSLSYLSLQYQEAGTGQSCLLPCVVHVHGG